MMQQWGWGENFGITRDIVITIVKRLHESD